MELLKLSKFKLQLQTLATEARDLRERERSVTEQCHILIQKQKQKEEEYCRKVQGLQAELASSNELRQKLERKVSYLQNDNALLENQQKELKATIQSLLQSKESFVKAYEESTCEMKRAIEARDRKLSILSEKINSHLSLFNSIEKEAFSIKQVVDNVQNIVGEKEELGMLLSELLLVPVAGLRSKIDKVSAFDKVFVEKILDLENKLKNNENEFQRKNRIISALEAQLEAAKIRNNCQTQIEETSMEALNKTLLAKDAVIKSLISEKEALHCQLGSLAIILQKIPETVANMNEEDQGLFSSAFDCQEDCDMVTTNEENRIKEVHQNSGETSPKNASNVGAAENPASPTCKEQNSIGNPQQEKNCHNSCVSELVCSSMHSPCSELQSAANGPSISVNNGEVNCSVVVQHLDSECSTTQAEETDDDVNNTN